MNSVDEDSLNETILEPPKIFISHSSDDKELAELIVDLLRSALTLPAENIRCTSVEGHRLPGGADTKEQLRKEILGASSLIGLISLSSFNSVYVLFELGARWGAQKNLIPLLVPGTEASVLEGPISDFNALSCDSNSQLQQLIIDVSNQIQSSPEPPNVYQKKIERILRYTVRSVPNDLGSSSSKRLKPINENSLEEAEKIIRERCKEKWPNDFQMQVFYEEQQRKALNELNSEPPKDIPQDVLQRIRKKCSDKWANDFSMRLFCEEEQIKAYRKINK